MLLAVLSLSMVGAAEAAKELKGMWGPGYFRPEAPVGVRFWISDKVGADLGIGLSSSEYYNIEAEDTETKLAYRIDFGLPIVAAGVENTVFFIRPGVLYASTPIDGYPDDSMTDLWISASLGVEHFVSSRLSVQLAHGFYYYSHDPGTEDSDTSSGFATEDFGISSIGFHYYLFPLD